MHDSGNCGGVISIWVHIKENSKCTDRKHFEFKHIPAHVMHAIKFGNNDWESFSLHYFIVNNKYFTYVLHICYHVLSNSALAQLL